MKNCVAPFVLAAIMASACATQRTLVALDRLPHDLPADAPVTITGHLYRDTIWGKHLLVSSADQALTEQIDNPAVDIVPGGRKVKVALQRIPVGSCVSVDGYFRDLRDSVHFGFRSDWGYVEIVSVRPVEC